MSAIDSAPSLAHALEEQHRVADAIVRGTIIPSGLRPAYWPHAMIADALAKLSSSPGKIVDVGILLDALCEADPNWPWGVHLRAILAEYERIEDAVDDRRQAKRDAITVYGLILDAERALEFVRPRTQAAVGALLTGAPERSMGEVVAQR